jgi:hypothetical protein
MKADGMRVLEHRYFDAVLELRAAEITLRQAQRRHEHLRDAWVKARAEERLGRPLGEVAS